MLSLICEPELFGIADNELVFVRQYKITGKVSEIIGRLLLD